jgi:hypothetical protein
MNPLEAPTIDAALWEAVKARAKQDRVSPEAWLRRQLDNPGLGSEAAGDAQPDATTDEVMLELAWLHFRALNLDLDEARELANAMFTTIESGDAQMAGPVGVQQRRYVFHRRTAAVSIRIGEGRIRLPLNAAMRLATALYYGPADLKSSARLAA